MATATDAISDRRPRQVPDSSMHRLVALLVTGETHPRDTVRGSIDAGVLEILRPFEVLYHDAITSAMVNLAVEIADDRGWESGYDAVANERYTTDDEIMRALQLPTTAAKVFVAYCAFLEIEPPELVKRAAGS